jgi:hypothetical protein
MIQTVVSDNIIDIAQGIALSFSPGEPLLPNEIKRTYYYQIIFSMKCNPKENGIVFTYIPDLNSFHSNYTFILESSQGKTILI